MTEQDILQLRDLAEAGQVQFKERIISKDDKYEIGCEMVAFSNSRGGRLPYTGAGSGVLRALEYDPNEIFSNGVDQREITHSSNEFVITIPRKVDQVNDQVAQNTTKLAHKTDPALSETDPVSDQVHSKTDPVNDQVAQNTTKLVQNTDPALSETDPVIDQLHSKTDPVLSETDPISNQSQYNKPKLKLSKKQQDIRNYCSIPRSRQEILQRAGVSDHFYNRKKYIYDLVEAGVLERTIPDKPHDPNQKYRRK